MGDETTERTTGELVPQPHGGALRHGGTNKGGGGRTSEAYKTRMRALATEAQRALVTQKILSNPEHPMFFNAWKFATEQGYGKAKETVEHSGAVGSYVVEVPAKAANAAEWAERYAKGEE